MQQKGSLELAIEKILKGSALLVLASVVFAAAVYSYNCPPKPSASYLGVLAFISAAILAFSAVFFIVLAISELITLDNLVYGRVPQIIVSLVGTFLVAGVVMVTVQSLSYFYLDFSPASSLEQSCDDLKPTKK